MRTNRRLLYAEDPTPDGGGGGSPGQVLTQEQVNALVGQRVAEAARKAKQEAEAALKARLGDRSLDEVLEAAEAVKAAEDARKTEAEKALEAARAKEAEAERLRAEAKAELHATRVRAALVAAGAPEAGVDAIKVPDLTVDSTPEEIKTAVEALKGRLPGLFATKQAAASDPGKAPAPKDQAGEFGAGGLAEFEARYPKPAA